MAARAARVLLVVGLVRGIRFAVFVHRYLHLQAGQREGAVDGRVAQADGNVGIVKDQVGNGMLHLPEQGRLGGGIAHLHLQHGQRGRLEQVAALAARQPDVPPFQGGGLLPLQITPQGAQALVGPGGAERDREVLPQAQPPALGRNVYWLRRRQPPALGRNIYWLRRWQPPAVGRNVCWLRRRQLLQQPEHHSLAGMGIEIEQPAGQQFTHPRRSR